MTRVSVSFCSTVSISSLNKASTRDSWESLDAVLSETVTSSEQ